jgi:hypothetical protein
MKRSFDEALLSERMMFTSLNKNRRTAEAANTSAIWTVSPSAALVLNGKSMFDEAIKPAMDPGMPNGSMMLPGSEAMSMTEDLAGSSLQLACAASVPDSIRHWQTRRASCAPLHLSQDLDRQVALEKWRGSGLRWNGCF